MSGDYYVLDFKAVEENQNARYIKARRTGEIIVPPGDFTSPMKSMVSGKPAAAQPQDAGREATSDVKQATPDAKVEPLPKYRAGEWIKKEFFDPSRLPEGY